MKRLVSIILSMLIVVSAIGVLPVLAEEKATSENFLDIFKANSTLVLNDEFEGDKLDQSKWSVQKGWGRCTEIWGTEEDGNVSVSDGCLKLRAYEKETRENKIIQSGEVNSRAAWSDGLIEVRAKLPKGKSVYPAIWTMGRDYDPKGNGCLWPHSGEIDIMEAFGDANDDISNSSTWQTLHTARPYTMNKGSAGHVATGVGDYGTPYRVPLNDEFHTFWVYMDGSIMIIGVDEYMMSIKDLNDPNLTCFKDWEQWLILGFQMGEDPQRTDYSVWEMLIDYVRVYRLEDIEDYSKYQIFEAENLEPSNRVTMNYNIPSAQNCVVTSNADINLHLKDIQAGNYDVYVDYVGADSGSYTAYFNGQKANTISLKKDYNAQMKYSKVGSITVEEKTDFQLKFKRDSGTLYLDKVFLVKTDNQSNIVLNNANSITTSNYIEVANEEELISALGRIKHGGTIKFLNDIELTKSLNLHCEMNLDLNGKTLKINKGLFCVIIKNEVITIKNGNVEILNGSSTLIDTNEENNATKLNIQNVNFTVNTSKSGYLFNDYYSAIDLKCNNCTFNFSDTTNNLKFIKGAPTFNNCTFNLNGKDVFLIKNNKNWQFNSCIVNDASMLFSSESALTGGKVTIANTTFNNLKSLTNFEENTQFVSIANNNVLKLNGEIISVSADMSGNFTMDCNHSYNDATCTKISSCMYCAKEIGEKPKDHISDNGTVTREADCYYSEITTYKCIECGEVLEEKETAPIKGHNISYELLGENTCTSMQYYKCSCVDCDYYYQKGAGTDISGAYTFVGHIIDESTKAEFDNGCTKGSGFYYTCKTCGTENLGYIEHIGTHNIYSTDFTAPTETANGSVTYRCRDCSFNKTRTIKAGEHIVTVDGVKYFTVDGDYFTPYQYDEKFMYYVDEDGNKYGSDDLVQTDKDITLKKVTIEDHEHIPDTSAEKNVVEPTCGKEGYTEYSCTICSKTFKADFTQATGKHTAKAGLDKVVAPTCKEKGYTEHTCAVCSIVYKDTYTDIDPEAHKPKVVSGKHPTCSETGLTEGSQCSVCNKILVAQEVISKTSHTPIVVPKKEPTCSEIGLTEGSKCKVCGEILIAQEVMPKVEHIIVTDLGKFPSCREEGLTTGSYCKVCGEVIVAQEIIPKLDHTEQIQFGYAPTCTKPGLTDRIWCGVCNEILQEAEVIPALPHNFIFKGKKDASYTTKGYTGDTVCSVCGEVESYGKEIPRKTLKKPTIKLSKKGNKLTVTIKKVTGAQKYEILIKIGKKWKKFTSKKLKFTKKLTKGKKYQVKVRAIAGTNKSKYSGIKKIKLK